MLNCFSEKLYKLLILTIISFIELWHYLIIVVHHSQVVTHKELLSHGSSVVSKNVEDRDHEKEVMLFKDCYLKVSLHVNHQVFEQH